METKFPFDEEISISLRTQMNHLMGLQKKINEGALFERFSTEMQWINCAIGADERNRFYERVEPSMTEKKKLDEIFDAIAKSVIRRGGSVMKQQ